MPYVSAEDLNTELSSLVAAGYKIVNTHFLGVQTDQARHIEYYGILYILQLGSTEIETLKKSEKV
jgi:hypothetical protein